MWQRFPPRMRKIITASLDEAGRNHRDEALVEDLLVAMANDPECAAAFMFEQAGIQPQRLVDRLRNGSAEHNGTPARASRLSDSAMHVLRVATGEADRLKHRHVGTEHLALALSRVDSTPASSLLKEFDFTPQRGEAALAEWLRRGMPRRRSGPENAVIRSPLVRRLMRPVQRLMHYPMLAWHLYVNKSIGHPGFVSNPYPLYRRLRETQPVRKDPIAPVWIITRYAETMTIMRDPRFRKDPFASVRLPPDARQQLDVPVAEAFRASLETVSMLFLDPPQHTRIRSIFNKTFTPRRIEGLRPWIQKMCDDILDNATSRGRMELMGELAAPLPVTVIAELLGFPPADYGKIKKWSDEMADALGLNPTPEQQAKAQRARQDMRVYFETIVQHLRISPGDNLLSALLAPENEVLNPDELFANSVLLLAAGHETTTNLIGNGVLALVRHPDQLRELQRHPELIESAVEELLRFDPPVQWTSRVAGEVIELAGQTLQPGDIVLASLGAANRDPALFADPERLDIRRAENKHIGFGTGIHFCLGASLARMEAQIAIGTLVRRFPNLRLFTRRPRWRKGITFRGVERLELSL